MNETWILYGANGYTGELIAREAVRRGLRPVLAGRDPARVRPLADALGLEWRCFPLDQPARLAAGIRGARAVLLAAGPFAHTSAPVVNACCSEGAHYLDITGEIGVFEALLSGGERARAAGVVHMPGVGFDVVPTDCLALALSRALPSATRLELAVHAGGSASQGTMRTMAMHISSGGCIRRAGSLQRVPHAWRTRDVPFLDRSRHAVSLPWGDVSTAYYTTGIPSVTTFMSSTPAQVRWLRLLRPLARVAGWEPAQRLARARISRLPAGPDAAARAASRSQVWGRVENDSGDSVEGTLECPEGYTLTATAAVECAHRVAAGDVPAGAWTPAGAFGPQLIEELGDAQLRLG